MANDKLQEVLLRPVTVDMLYRAVHSRVLEFMDFEQISFRRIYY
jgi:hypothetical protein